MKAQDLILKELKQIPAAEEQPVKIRNKDTNYKAIIDPKTNTTFAIVSKDYQLTQHQEVWKQVIKNKKYKIESAAIFKKGRVMMIELIPVEETKIELLPKSKDYLQPRVRIFNSYDSTKALSVQGYGMRLICSNGATAPGMTTRYKRRHAFKNIDLKVLDKQIDLALASWTTSAATLQKSASTTVLIKDALKELGKFPKKYTEIALSNLKKDKDTLYNIWNALTSAITHDMQPNVSTGTLVKYQNRVNRIFNLLNDPETDPVLNDNNPALEEE